MYKSCLCLRYGSIKLCVDQAKRDGVTVYELLFFPWFFRRIVKRKWDWIIYHENYLFLSISFLYIYSKLFVWMMKKKQHGTKLHAIPHFLVGSFAVWDHLRSNLGIISGLVIICSRRSFAVLYRCVHLLMHISNSKLNCYSVVNSLLVFDAVLVN